MRARAANQDHRISAAARPSRRWPRHPVFYLSILLTAAIAVLAAIILSKDSTGSIPGFVPVVSQPLAPNVAEAPDRVSFVRIEGQGNVVELARGPEGWRLASSSGYPVAENAVMPMLRALGGLEAAYVSDISPPPYDVHGLTGLEDPAGQTVRITLQGQDGTQVAALTVGTTVSAPGGGAQREMTAIMRPNDSRIWLVEGNVKIVTDPLAWVDHRIAEVPAGQVRRLTTVAPDGTRLVLERPPEGGRLQVVEGLPAGARVGEAWLVGEIASVFTRLDFQDVQPAKAFDPQRQDAWRVELVTRDGAVLRAILFREDMGTWAVVRAEAPADDGEAAQGAARFNARHDGWAYLLGEFAARRLTTRPTDLLGAKQRNP